MPSFSEYISSCRVIVLVFHDILYIVYTLGVCECVCAVACIVTSQWILARSRRNNSSLLKDTDEGSLDIISSTYAARHVYQGCRKVLSRLSENLRHEVRNATTRGRGRINQYRAPDSRERSTLDPDASGIKSIDDAIHRIAIASQIPRAKINLSTAWHERRRPALFEQFQCRTYPRRNLHGAPFSFPTIAFPRTCARSRYDFRHSQAKPGRMISVGDLERAYDTHTYIFMYSCTRTCAHNAKGI